MPMALLMHNAAKIAPFAWNWLETSVLRVSLVLLLMLLLAAHAAPLSLAQVTSGTPRDAAPVGTPEAGGQVVIPDLTGVTPLPLEGARRADFAAFIAETMIKCPVPGASVAVVQDGAVVFLDGFGVRELGRTAPVTPQTLMRVGSVTKSFTALLAAALVDAGLMSWDTPVQALLPAFTLSDPELGARLTMAEIFSAASGLPRRDLEFAFESDAYTPATLLAAVARLPLTAPPGATYQYSNQAFAVGGYAAAAAAGAAPDDLLAGYRAALRHRVLNPIGMTRSTFVLSEVLHSGDYAAPHAPEIFGGARTLSLLEEDRFTTAITPAGGMWSTAADLARYLQTLLAGGVAPDDTRVVSTAQLDRLWQPGVTVPPNPQLPSVISAGLAHYGLGWYTGEFGGLTLLSHSGGAFGFAAELALLPQANLGIAVLANDPICGAMLSYAVQYRLFELVFALDPAAEAEYDAFLGAVQGQRAAAIALLGAVEPDEVAPLLGRYTHPELGEIEFRMTGDALVIDAGELHSRLAPLRMPLGGEARYVALDPPLSGTPGWFTFEQDPGGRPVAVLTAIPDPVAGPLVYRFRPIAPQSEPAATPAP